MLSPIVLAAVAMPLAAADISTPAAAVENNAVECFVKERITREEVPWNKYYSPEFVNISDDGTVKITVKRSGGPIGGMVLYYVHLNQKKAGKITISAESRGSGFKGKDGYAYRLCNQFRYHGGDYSKEDRLYFPGTPDGNWHKVEKVYELERPVNILHLHVSLCYRDGEAEFRNISVKVDPASLNPFTPPAKK